MIDLQPSCDAVARLIAGIDDGQLDAPSPCPGWTVGEVVDHLDLMIRGATALALGDRGRRRGHEPGAPESESRQTGRVQFSAELRDDVASGRITVSYRLWSRPKVKVGGVYRSGAATIEIDELELVPFSSVTDDDLVRTGEPDLERLRRRAAHAGPIDDDTLVYRVEFHVVHPPDDALSPS